MTKWLWIEQETLWGKEEIEEEVIISTRNEPSLNEEQDLFLMERTFDEARDMLDLFN